RIDPSINQLFFRGLDATELARSSDFESVLYLLVQGSLPNSNQRGQLVSQMIKLRGLYREEYQSMEILARNLDIIRDEQGLNLHDTLLTFVTLCPIVIANQFAESQGKKAENPDNDLNHAANFLWMVQGDMPTQTDVADFQTALILPMDDPDNPSLTALLEVLERGEVSEAILAALKEHVGALHHGAGTEAMMMFQEIQNPERTREHLVERLKSGEKIFGLGHRIYTGIDPRAVILRGILERRTLNTTDAWLVSVSDEVTKEGGLLLSDYKGIQAFANIDLYNAAVYYTLGFPPELNTSLFAISRSAGWMAHILEQTNKKTFQKG
ncbi:MAG: citrate/2-methylcitrate synthase, partial [Promethearchaeota archaeon]